jgi:hypothetical protein
LKKIWKEISTSNFRTPRKRSSSVLQEDVHIKTVEGELQMTKKKLEVESRREELVIYQNDPPDLSSSRFREDPNLDFLKGC